MFKRWVLPISIALILSLALPLVANVWVYLQTAWSWVAALPPLVLWWLLFVVSLIALIPFINHFEWLEPVEKERVKPMDELAHEAEQLVQGEATSTVIRLVKTYLWQDSLRKRCPTAMSAQNLATLFEPSLAKKLLNVSQLTPIVTFTTDELILIEQLLSQELKQI